MAKNWPREIALTELEAQLVLSKTARFGDPINLGEGYVAVAPEMPTRRSISVEEFEADMRAARLDS